MANGKTYDAIIVGGGIAGCTLAYELARRDLKVVVLEQENIGASSSGKNTGTLLTGPQAEVVELLDACVDIYKELADGPVPFEFGKVGHILVAGDDRALEKATGHARSMAEVGIGLEKFTGEEIARDYPHLRLNLAGGYYVDKAYTLEPMGATQAFAHAAREMGVEFRVGCRVSQIHTKGGKFQGVLCDDGIVAGDMVFLANGLWVADMLRRTVGDSDGPLPSLPFIVGRGWLIQLAELDFELPWIVEELSWPDQAELGNALSLNGLPDVAEMRDERAAIQAICLNPMKGGDARLGATNQPALRDLIRNTSIPASIASRAIRLVGALSRLSVKNAYPGNRPMLSDGMPAAGRSRIEGIYVHAGLGSIGMHAAPATARWLVDAVIEGKGQPDKPWLVPDRFKGWGAQG